MTVPSLDKQVIIKQLVYHSEQPNKKSIVTADLEKDEGFT